jgi:two-component system response regulator HydG
MLKSLGHEIEEAATDRLALRLMERNPINLVLASVDPGDADALELLTYVRRKHSSIPVILMFPRVHPERAKEALRLGAMTVLKYPVPAAELRAAVIQALEQFDSQPAHGTNGSHVTASSPPAPYMEVLRSMPRSPVPVAAAFTSEPGVASHSSHQSAPHGNGATLNAATAVNPMTIVNPAAYASPTSPKPIPTPVAGKPANQRGRDVGLITMDHNLGQVVDLAHALATVPAPILILGEPGTGKSLLALVLHLGAGAADRPFVTMKATDYDEALTEDDDAEERTHDPEAILTEWNNKLAQARGGSLYIDEVGSLPAEIQQQLLRELQLQDLEGTSGHLRDGGRPAVRFILSSSGNLSASVEQGVFRSELYHRISSFCLMVPPLRHRRTDIELLAEHFRVSFAEQYHKEVSGFTRDALDALQRHEWPGNVRELKGVVQRAVARCGTSRITSNHLAPILDHHRQARGGAGMGRPHLPMGIRPLKEALEEPEKRIIIQALQAFNWNRQETARVLDINRTTLYKKMKKYGLLMDEPIWVN